jgi:aspartate aminotransferase
LLRKGNKVYHLNIGQPDIKTQVAMEAVKEILTLTEYSHSAGFESYRNKLLSKDWFTY